jgi:hypothetical protein
MERATESITEIAELHRFEGRPVRVRLRDASEHVGTLRTELLSPRSISVYLATDVGEGATIYIDEIVGIWPTS